VAYLEQNNDVVRVLCSDQPDVSSKSTYEASDKTRCHEAMVHDKSRQAQPVIKMPASAAYVLGIKTQDD
jgi:hypothetical protein